MFKLIAVTLAALYGILYVYGDPARQPEEVARSSPLGFDLSAAAALPDADTTITLHITAISESEAIDRAIAAGRAKREGIATAPKSARSIRVQNVEETSVALVPTEQLIDYWYVTGSRVNLRGGPSTSEVIVGQATLGMEAEVLSGRNGWYEIRLADGSGSGWIFGEFLKNQQPG